MSEKHDDSSAVGSSLLVFLLGMAVGAAVAILYAPAAGAETRSQIADKAEHLKERATEISHQVAEKATEIKEKVATRVRHADAPAPETVPES